MKDFGGKNSYFYRFTFVRDYLWLFRKLNRKKYKKSKEECEYHLDAIKALINFIAKDEQKGRYLYLTYVLDYDLADYFDSIDKNLFLDFKCDDYDKFIRLDNDSHYLFYKFIDKKYKKKYEENSQYFKDGILWKTIH